jgi:hypothetical protein
MTQSGFGGGYSYGSSKGDEEENSYKEVLW